MATTTILVNGDGTTTSWTNESAGSSNLYLSIDEGTDSPNDSDYITTSTASSTATFLLEDMPVNFDTASSVNIKIRCKRSGTKGDIFSINTVQLVESDGSTAITNTANVAETTTTATYTLSPTITGGTDKTTWDGARLKIANNGGTSGNVTIYAVQIEVTHSETGGSSYDETGSGGVVSGGSGLSPYSAAWYNSSWLYRISIVVDSAQVASDITDFVIYVDLSTLGSDFFANVKSDGGDIRITESDGTTEVPREVVFITTGSSIGEMHFKGDVSSSTDTVYYIYYGNSGASEPSSSDTYGSEAVWSAYSMVLHLNETVNNSAGGYSDSSGNSNTGTGTSMAITAPDGQLAGKCAEFDGAADFISITNKASIQLTSSFAVSCWCKRDADGAFDGIVSKAKTTGGIRGWNLNFRDTSDYFAGLVANASGFDYIQASPTDATDFDWHHFVIYNNGTNTRTYFDTVVSGTTPTRSIVDSGQPLVIGRFYADSSAHYLDGKVDEVRYYNGTLPTGWVDTEYANQSDVNNFYLVELQEDYPGASNSTYNETASGGIEGGGNVNPYNFIDLSGNGGLTGGSPTNTGTEILRPTGNINALWGPNDYTLIDDPVESPTAGDGSVVEADGNDDNENQIWSLDAPSTLSTITDITLYVRHYFDDDGQPGVYDVQGNVKVGGSFLSSQTLTTSISGYIYDSVTWSGTWDAGTDFSDFQVSVQVGSLAGVEAYQIDVLYIELTGQGGGNTLQVIYNPNLSGGTESGGVAEENLSQGEITASGGIEGGGTASSNINYDIAFLGGIEGGGGGNSLTNTFYFVSALGGSEVGGTNLNNVIYDDSALNGIEASGTTSINVVYPISSIDGILIGGNGENNLTPGGISSSGGVEVGGLTLTSTIYTTTSSNGIEIGGTTPVNLIYAILGGNGCVSGGVASNTSLVQEISESNGLEIGGTSSIYVIYFTLSENGIEGGGVAIDDESAAQLTSTGGITGGGVAFVGVTTFISTSGGVLTSGISELSKTFNFITSGGGEVGGTTSIQYLSFIESNNGVECGGTPSLICLYYLAASDGLLLSGVGTNNIIYSNIDATGGGECAGLSEYFSEKYITAFGGAASEGNTTLTALYFPQATAGIELSGTGTQSSISQETLSGGLVASSNVDLFIQYQITTSDGIIIGGNTEYQTFYNLVAENGVVISGTSYLQLLYQINTNGSLLAGGVNNLISIINIESLGGIEIAGQGILQIFKIPAINGGAVSGGDSITLQIYSSILSGGIVIGGNNLNSLNVADSGILGGIEGGGTALEIPSFFSQLHLIGISAKGGLWVRRIDAKTEFEGVIGDYIPIILFKKQDKYSEVTKYFDYDVNRWVEIKNQLETEVEPEDNFIPVTVSEKEEKYKKEEDNNRWQRLKNKLENSLEPDDDYISVRSN